jgi:hypothetical protein
MLRKTSGTERDVFTGNLNTLVRCFIIVLLTKNCLASAKKNEKGVAGEKCRQGFGGVT